MGEEGKVYAIDCDKQIIESVNLIREEQKISNLFPIRLKDDKMTTFDKEVDFIMYYDVFHSMSSSMERKMLAN